MRRFLKAVFGWLSGGALDRILDTVDRRVAADTDRQKIKGDIIKHHYQSRPDFMRAGGFILMMIFALPLAFWFGAVCIYSVFWCQDCAFPRDFTIAALPGQVGQWAHLIITAIFGVIGVTSFTGRR